uniref:Protein kinase domain-containing protein n=1 Tax=Acrobeloides nanus TaxID=290746 RepID=A0A914E2V0_9BILA
MLRALHDLHNIGYVHRYIRPQIFAIGQGEKCRTGNSTVYLTDFDLAWKFIDEKTKTHKPPGTRRFIDSICYASMKSHMCQELSRRDDLESWLYLSLELFDRQHLAWHDVTIAETVLNKKKNFAKNPDPKIFQKLALQYRLIMEHIMALSFDDAPEYPRLFALIAEAAKSLNVDFTSPYDWEP